MLALQAGRADLEAEIKDFNPDIVGTGYTTPQNRFAVEIIRTAKKLGKIAVIGGPHPTALPREALMETGADAAYLYEVEHTLLESLEAVLQGKLSPALEGVAYLEDGKLIKGPPGIPIEDLNNLPRLDYGDIPFRVYSTKQQTIRFPRQRPMATFITSRGCPHKCSFCMNFMGRRWRYKSAQHVLSEIEDLVNRFGVRELWILDDNFTNKKSRTLEICEGIRKNHPKITIRFPNGVRADRIDEDIVKALKAAGCYNIAFGIESGNQAILDKLGKGIRLERMREAVGLANKHGLLTSGFFVLGLPGDTEQTIHDSIRFAVTSGLSDASFFIATPYPGTRLWDAVKDRINLKWDQYDQDAFIPLSCSENITPERLLALSRIANRKFYFRPKVFFHIARYLFNPAAFSIFKNKLLSYVGLRSGNV
jgi:radical SAM superfamily enzyme YgiQ (UPF0313 family)